MLQSSAHFLNENKNNIEFFPVTCHILATKHFTSPTFVIFVFSRNNHFVHVDVFLITTCVKQQQQKAVNSFTGGKIISDHASFQPNKNTSGLMWGTLSRQTDGEKKNKNRKNKVTVQIKNKLSHMSEYLKQDPTLKTKISVQFWTIYS